MKYITLILLLLLISCRNFSKEDFFVPDYIKKFTDTTSLILNRETLGDSVKKFIYKNGDNLENEILISIATSFYTCEDMEGFYATSKILLRHSLKSNDEFSRAKSYKYLGIYNVNLKKYDSAYYYLTKAEKTLLKSHPGKLLVGVYLEKSIIQYRMGNFFDAEKLAIAALKILNNFPNNQQKFDTYTILGSIATNLGEYESGLNYHFRAYKIAKFTNSENEVIVLNNLGNVYEELKMYKKAIPLYLKALTNSIVLKNFPELHARILDNYAYCKFRLNNKGSLPLFLKSYEWRKKLGNKEDLIYSQLHLSEYYVSINDTNRALAFAKEALIVSKEQKSNSKILLVLNFLLKFDNVGRHKYINDFTNINQQIQFEERGLRNEFARIDFETDEILKQKQRVVRHNLISIFTFIIISTFLFLLLIIKIQKERTSKLQFTQFQKSMNEEIYELMFSQQNRIQEAKNKEKSRIARELHDGVLNRLTSTRLNLFVLNKRNDKETIKKCLPFISDIQFIEKEIRNISHSLYHSSFLEVDNFHIIIQDLLEKHKDFEIKFSYKMDKRITWENIETVKKIHIYRILQESLQNVIQHSGARNVFIKFAKRPAEIHIAIFDDGKGIKVNCSGGIGLKNIKSRVDEISGGLKIDSSLNMGTKIIVTIPL